MEFRWSLDGVYINSEVPVLGVLSCCFFGFINGVFGFCLTGAARP